MWPANEGSRAWREGWVCAWPADKGGQAWDTNNTIRQPGYNETICVVVDETKGGDHCGRQIAIAEHLEAFPMHPVPYTVCRRRIEKFM